MKTVYLAGPIYMCDRGEANDWRKDMSSVLKQDGIIGISPLRCEPLIGDKYELSYKDPRFGTPRAIASKNWYDVQTCDVTLAYLPKELNDRRPSYGTVIEIGWAKAFNKPVVLVSDDEAIMKHPVISSCASWKLENLDQATELLIGLLGDYGE